MSEKFKNLFKENYFNNKSKNFVIHLLKSFFPPEKINLITSFTNEKKKERRCSMCKSKLMDLGDINKEKLLNPNFKSINEFLDAFIERKEYPKPLIKEKKEKYVGFTTTETNTCLCIKCIIGGLLFMKERFIENDKLILKIINDKKIMKYFKPPINIINQRKTNLIVGNSENQPLLENEILLKLKKEMENECDKKI